MPLRPPNKAALPGFLRATSPPWGDQVAVEASPWPARGDAPAPDLRVTLTWADAAFPFAAVSRSRSTPRTIEEAITQAIRASRASGLPPMIIVPHLDDRRLDRLADEQVSGIDLSGNGLAILPGRLLLRSSGRPNRFPESQPTRYAYRGTTSLVPRMFLGQPAFPSVGAIRAAISERGGAVAMSTVSKALARMVEDVLVERSRDRIMLQQPESLLDRLEQDFQMPAARATVRVKVEPPLATLLSRINRDASRPRLVLSGASSQDRYAAGLRADELVLYTDNLHDARKRAGGSWRETDRFADITVIETDDPLPFFDTRLADDGLAIASPVQAYLELCSGDKRDREQASDIRAMILRAVKGALDGTA